MPGAAESTFSVYAQFRHRMLVLRRGFRSLEDAIDFAARLRAEVEEHQEIFVVHHRTEDPDQRPARISGTRYLADEFLDATEQGAAEALSAARRLEYARPTPAVKEVVARLEAVIAAVEGLRSTARTG